MNRREQLRENYEDALFALLMEDMLEEEGEQLREENERLKRDPGAAIPDDVDRRCRKTIQHAYSKGRRRIVGRTVYRGFKNAAMAAVICAMLFAVAYAAIPELRVNTLNLLIEVSDAFTKLTLTGDGDPVIEGSAVVEGDGPLLLGYRIPAVPEGFVWEKELSRRTRKFACAYYVNDDGAFINFYVEKTEGGPFHVDTEDAENVETVSLHGHEGLLIEKRESIHIVWGDTDRNTFCGVFCVGVDKETALELAGGIAFVGEED